MIKPSPGSFTRDLTEAGLRSSLFTEEGDGALAECPCEPRQPRGGNWGSLGIIPPCESWCLDWHVGGSDVAFHVNLAPQGSSMAVDLAAPLPQTCCTPQSVCITPYNSTLVFRVDSTIPFPFLPSRNDVVVFSSLLRVLSSSPNTRGPLPRGEEEEAKIFARIMLGNAAAESGGMNVTPGFIKAEPW